MQWSMERMSKGGGRRLESITQECILWNLRYLRNHQGKKYHEDSVAPEKGFNCAVRQLSAYS